MNDGEPIMSDLHAGLYVFVLALALNASPTRAENMPLCGASIDAEEALAVRLELEDFLAAPLAPFAARVSGTIIVPTHVHVIQSGPGIANGEIPEAQVRAQIDLLNLAYANSAAPFEFRLEGITRTINANWYTMSMGSSEELEAKRSLRVGGAETLNIYAVRAPGGLSWSTFPHQYRRQRTLDGVVVSNSWWAGGSGLGSNDGDVLVHEIGHWLGLYHTFQGGCSGAGDEVDDTPAEEQGSNCALARDSCPQPGIDPSENYMSYSWTYCTYRFTPGQIARAQALHALYRSSANKGHRR